MNDREHKLGAGTMILLVAITAVLLLWMDSWSHSIPVIAATAAVALLIFLAFRNAAPHRELTQFERIEMERDAAHRWMARNGARPEDEARDNRPQLEVIQGGKTPPPDDEGEAEEESAG